MISVSRAFIEFVLAIGSLLVLGISGAFALATTRSQLAISKIQLEIKSNQLEFARKIQQNIDSNKVEIGALKCEVRDIKGLLRRERNFKERQEFPPENIPPHTDF